MKNTVYCIYAYKPDSEDYCRGCHMASYSSDFICEEKITEKELIATLVNIFKTNRNLRVNEDGYDDVKIFIGIEDDELETCTYEFADNDDRQYLLSEKANAVINTEIAEKARQNQLLQEENNRVAQENIVKQKVAQEVEEVETLKRLQKKYPHLVVD